MVCGSCIRSVCLKCVGRVSGKAQVESLLTDDDMELTCYTCDPDPIQLYSGAFEKWQARQPSNTNAAKVKLEPKTPACKSVIFL